MGKVRSSGGLVPQPIANRLFLFNAGPFPVADTVGENGGEALAFGAGEPHAQPVASMGLRRHFKRLLVIGPPAIMRGGGKVG